MQAKFIGAGALALAVALSATAGYWLGTGSRPGLEALTSRRDASPGMQTAVNPKTAVGRDQVPVHEKNGSELPAGESKPVAAAAPPSPRKLLYYRNPMGLPDTSPVPKKDWMGMDYIAVYEGDEPAGTSTVKISLDKVQRTGVRSEEARLVKLSGSIRATGIAKPDQRSLRTITLRADGFIEKLYANEHGKHVKAGEPLFRVYSQDMLRALIDYRLGLKETAGHAALLTSEQKLRNFEVPQSAIDEARQSKDLPMSFDWPSPVSGVIMEKKAIEGQMAKIGEELFLIGDLSNIWVIADVPEQEADAIKIGAAAAINFRGLPGETFHGKVTFILHELDQSSRTLKVRIEVPNPNHRIKHEMYAEVVLDSGGGEPLRLAVPSSAVIDSGTRQVVIVDKGDGRFEPRPIVPGIRVNGLVEIRQGLLEGEKVVVTANFLIDAESNIKAALEAFTAEAKP